MMPPTPEQLERFQEESNRIEGIRIVRPHEVEALDMLLELEGVWVRDLANYVRACAGAPLRSELGMDVYVGHHVPPPGGLDVPRRLGILLERVNEDCISPFEAHSIYEDLHPFMDGNGRSGRALWAWHMRKRGFDPFRRGFLHEWYYQSLEANRAK